MRSSVASREASMMESPSRPRLAVATGLPVGGTGEEGSAEPIQIGDLELLHHVDEPPAAFVVAGGASVNVALDLQRLAHIGAHEAQQVLIHAALAGEWHDWDRQALFEHLAAVGSHAEAADVDH